MSDEKQKPIDLFTECERRVVILLDDNRMHSEAELMELTALSTIALAATLREIGTMLAGELARQASERQMKSARSALGLN